MVDLPAVQVALDEIERVLLEHPETRERTAAWMAGALEGMEADEMVERDDGEQGLLQIGVRLTPDMLERVDGVIPYLEAQPTVQALGRKVTRSLAVRFLVGYGLGVLEAEQQQGKGKRK